MSFKIQILHNSVLLAIKNLTDIMYLKIDLDHLVDYAKLVGIVFYRFYFIVLYAQFICIYTYTRFIHECFYIPFVNAIYL